MVIKKLREQKQWSQEQLATLSGLSIRTIQRIESGNRASLESLKSLAAVFEIRVCCTVWFNFCSKQKRSDRDARYVA